MEKQIFVHEMKATFNLREPKGKKPTNIYFVVRVDGKQVKLATGVKVYPNHWNKDKQEAYVSYMLSELDNRNNEIANRKIQELKVCFLEYKNYLCSNPDKIEDSYKLLKERIYKDSKIRGMKKKQELSATATLLQISLNNMDIQDSSKSEQCRTIKKFAAFLKDNKISDVWENMNCDTLNKYQNKLISEDKTPNAIQTNFRHILSLLKKASKRTDIPFEWSKNNLDNFEVIKDKSNKTKRNDKKIALTTEQLKKIYAYTSNNERRNEVKDMFILQCLVGQRISDMSKFINSNYELDTENKTISITQQKTGAIATIPLFDETKEILEKYKDGLKYPKVLERNSSSQYNSLIKQICKDVGLNEEITYQEQRGTKVKTLKAPLYKLVHSHTARHTFVTIMCRMDVPKDTIIIATGHYDTTMINEVYEHLSQKDKSNKITKDVSNKIGSSLFNVKQETKEENTAYEFGKAFSKLEQEHKDDMNKLSFEKDIDKAFDIMESKGDILESLIEKGLSSEEIANILNCDYYINDNGNIEFSFK